MFVQGGKYPGALWTSWSYLYQNNYSEQIYDDKGLFLVDFESQDLKLLT